jgi:hypothetical protein
MKIIITKVSNGALLKVELNKSETESGKCEKYEKVFRFDCENPEGIIEMISEIFETVIFLGDDKYEQEAVKFICKLINVHGKKYDSSNCESTCKLCRNAKLLEGLEEDDEKYGTELKKKVLK